ncbi:MAG: C40 family peptidase [Rubrobacter sp.]|nr:C40 family peptidase [Rubrobacteraceae bacterium]MDQ3251766.1 C40 family peptidase [Actinomycetota bacterium]
MHIVRQLAAVLLSSALFSAVLLAGSPNEAYADVSGQAVVDNARSYIGTPYGASGMDCSGFTSAVFADLGVYLPDGPDTQYAYGTPSGGEAGDLVFFDESGYGISHVGIATGYGTVIHASTYYGAVVESPIEYIPGYVGAVDAY